MLLVLAVACGLVASIGINQAMSRPVTDQAPAETTEIFVAKAEIGLGDALKPDVIKLEAWPADKVPAGALTKLEETVDRRTRTKIYPGEPILENKLLAKGEDVADAANMIPKGFRVVSIRVDAVSGAASLIKPGDRVDVLVHLQENTSRGITKTTTKTFLQHIKVFAVDDVFRRENDGGQTVAAKTISLLVTPQQAELVTMASELGTIRLVMRSASDEDKSDTPGSTPGDLPGLDPAVPAAHSMLLSGAPQAPVPVPVPAPVVAPLPKVVEPPAEPKDHFTMKMLLGPEEVRDVDFEDGHPVKEQDEAPTTNPNTNESPVSPLTPFIPHPDPIRTPPQSTPTTNPDPGAADAADPKDAPTTPDGK
jgi:pilus assembly protein CpaB